MIRNIALILGTRLWGSVSGLALYLALARRMGPELQGVVSFSVMLVNLLVLCACLGLDSSVIYFLNRIGVGARHYVRRVVPLLAGSALAAVAIILALNSAGILNGQGSGTPWILLLVLLLFPLDIVINLMRYLFLARERIGDLNRIDQVQFLLLMIFVGLVLVFWPQSPTLVMVAYLADRAAVVALVLWRISKHPLDVDNAESATPRAGEILRYSVYPWIGNVLSVLGIRLDTIMVAWFVSRSAAVSAADLGFYTICMMAMARVQDVQLSVQSAVFPRVASLPQPEAKILAAKYYRITWFVYLGIFLAVALAGAPVLTAFGAGYRSAYPALVTMAFGILMLRANAGVLAIYFTSIGRPDIPMWVNGIATLANLGLNLILIPRLGILGAAASSVGACLVSKVLFAGAFTWKSGTYWQDLILRREDWRDVKQWVKEKIRDQAWKPRRALR